MPFACGRTCVVVAVVVLVGFVVAAYVCGRREAFDANASEAVDAISTVVTSNTLYASTAPAVRGDPGACYPSQVLRNDSKLNTCTSFAFQNPATYKQNVYVGTPTPLQDIVFVNENKTLEDILLDPAVKTRIERVMSTQARYAKKMRQDHTTMHNTVKQVNDVLKQVQEANQASSAPVPPLPTPPKLSSTPPADPCAASANQCTYETYKYVPQTQSIDRGTWAALVPPPTNAFQGCTV